MPRTFSDVEMQRRVKTLRAVMADQGIVCAVLTSVHNIMYLSGFWHGQPYGRHCVVVVPSSGDCAIVSPRMEAGRARDFTWIRDLRVYTDDESPFEGSIRLTADILSERNLHSGALGVEEDVVPFAFWSGLQKAVPNAQLKDISEGLERLRLVKSAEEIELTRKLARLCEAALRGFDEALRAGTEELELSAVGEAAMRREFPKIFPETEYIPGRAQAKSGSRLWGHHGPIAKKLERGDLVTVHATPIVMGYFSTLTRLRMIGPIPEAVKRVNAVVMEAKDRCIEAIKPGVKFSEIDNTALRVFQRAGMAEDRARGTGHSHGLMGPFWGREKAGEYRPYNHTVLEAGMITSMEPGLFVRGIGSVHTNDMILVTKTGAELLTHYPQELRSVG
jgi:creatinase